MYVGNDLGSYGGLAGLWQQPVIVNPEQYIPQKHVSYNADQAAAFLQRPRKSLRKALKKAAKKKGGVYWTNRGPEYSITELKKGRKAEKVPAPKPKFRPDIEVVRDLPKLAFPPLPGQEIPAKAKAIPKPKPAPSKTMEGFSEAMKGGILPLLFLGLVFIGLVGYNKL